MPPHRRLERRVSATSDSATGCLGEVSNRPCPSGLCGDHDSAETQLGKGGKELRISIVADGFSEPLSQGQSTELAFGILLSR